MNSQTTIEYPSIVLLSDDDDPPENQEKCRESTECLNVECSFGEEYLDSVPEFVLNYYKIKRSKGVKVCIKCYDEACEYFSDLKKKYENRQSIYDTPSPKYKDIVCIDSDEEDQSPEEELCFDEETTNMIKQALGPTLQKVMNDPKTRFQLDDAYEKAIEDANNFLDEYKEIDKFHTDLQAEIDNIREQIYYTFKPIIQELPPIEIIDVASPKPKFPNNKHVQPRSLLHSTLLKNASMNRKKDKTTGLSEDILEVTNLEVTESPKSLPSQNIPYTKPKIRKGDFVYTMRYQYQHSWKLGTVLDFTSDKENNFYEIRFTSSNRKSIVVVPGKNIACSEPAPFRFVVGFRIIAVFSEDRVQVNQDCYYSGTIAEPPKLTNKYRYLVFFDDGCAQYVPHKFIRQICEPHVNPWEDVPERSRGFMRRYLMEYPERPMVKLQTGNIVKVEYQTEWLPAKVLEVDSSLANMLYLIDGRTEWIYRGSPRLEPLFKTHYFDKRRKEGVRVRRITAKYNADSPYVEYTQADEENSYTSSRSRSVAKKSTSKRSNGPLNWVPIPTPGGIDRYKKLVNVPKPKKFVPHQCGNSCIAWSPFDPSKTINMGPLEAPLHFGYRRIISHFGKDKRCVLYRAPCGRNLRNMEEIHGYLRITNSEMTVDLFDFDYWVDCLAEFKIYQSFLHITDITRGGEKYPIDCVNYIDSSAPDFTSYLAERMPRDNVGLNLDPEFLCSCDCTDDCQDKAKCSCWQMTIDSQNLIPNPDDTIDPNIGYHYRRLPERVVTGIYECNSQCKCSKITCLNRVVQYPLKQKLQLYKTQMKGWGLRCLTDIPQGSFICVYAGYLLTDQEANEEGKTYGDEYLAELDYIEVIETTKEGYESDVPENLEDDLRTVRAQIYEERNKDSDSSDSVPEANLIDDTDSRDNIKSRLRERLIKKTTDLLPAKTPTLKPKKEKFSIRKYYTGNDDVFIMDAKCSGNIGRFLNHSCMPNVFVQNVFVDTHDIRFPWVAFFAQIYIPAGTELTWDYNYDIGSVDGKVKYCYCGTEQCRKRLL